MNCFHSPALDHTNKERLENHRGGGGGGTQRTNKSEQKMSQVSRIVPWVVSKVDRKVWSFFAHHYEQMSQRLPVVHCVSK